MIYEWYSKMGQPSGLHGYQCYPGGRIHWYNDIYDRWTTDPPDDWKLVLACEHLTLDEIRHLIIVLNKLA